MKEQFTLRLAVPEDAEQIIGIYSRYVTETAVTFESHGKFWVAI